VSGGGRGAAAIARPPGARAGGRGEGGVVAATSHRKGAARVWV